MADTAAMRPIRVKAALLRRIGRAVTFAGTTLLLCAVGLVLSVNTQLARTLIADAVTRSLAGYFCGEISVESIGEIGLSAIRGVSLSVIDPQANQVLRLRNLDAHVALLPTLREVLLNRKSIPITVAELSIEQMNLYAEADAGSINLQRAFRVCAPPSKTERTVRLAIRKMRIAHLLAHVEVPTVPAFDAEFKDLNASLLLIPGKLAIDVERFVLATRGMMNGADVAGSGDFKFVLPFAKPRDVLARTHWAGRVYGTDLSVDVQWLAGLLRLGLDAPHVPVQTLRRFWGDFPDGLDASVHAELQGTPPEFTLQARVAQGQGALDVTGQVNLGDQRRADLHVTIDSMDLRQVFVRAPSTSIRASAEITAQQTQSGPVSGEVRLELPQTTIAGISMPPASVQASFLHIPGANSSVDARVAAREPGAPAQLTCHLTSDGKDVKVTFEGGMHAARLDSVPRLARFAQGSATTSVQGNLDLTHGTLNASVGLDASSFHRGGLDIERARVRALLRGPLKSPRLDFDLGANQLTIAGVKFADAHVQARGPVTTTRFNADLRAANGASVSLAGQLGLDETLTVRDLLASFDGGTGAVKAHANIVRVRDGGIAVEALRIEGLGESIDADLVLTPRKMRLRTIAKGLDIARVAQTTRLGNYGGLLDLDAELSIAPGHADGRVAFNLSDAHAGRITGWAAQGEANLRDRNFDAHVRGEYGKSNSLELQTDSVRLDGAGDELAHWKNCSGRVAIDARADIVELIQRLPSDLIGLADLQGKVGLHADIARAEGSPANVTLSAKGSRLGFSLSNDAKTSRARTASAPAAQSPQFRGLEANLGLAYDGAADAGRAKLQVSDGAGIIATLDVSADAIPLQALITSPREQLLTLPVTAQLHMPRRALKSLPGSFVPERYLGDVESKLTWRGSLAHPDVALESRVTQARIPRTLSRPVDITLMARYDGERVDGNLKTVLDSSPVLDADLRVATRTIDWFSERADASVPWEGSVRARLIGFPLESVRALGNSEVSGALNGELEIEGLHRDAKANLKLETKKLRVHDLVLTAGTAQVVLGRDHFDARLRLEENSAYAEVRLNGVPNWGAALVPAIDDSQPARAALSADRFRIATLLPFTNGLLSDLDGRVHAELSAEIDRREGAARLSGVATLQGGVFELAAGGGEFHDMDATLVFKPDGSVELQSMTAKGVTGHLQMTARARFDGFGWASTEAHLRMPANSPIPLTLQGAGYGTAFGQIDVLAVRAPNRRDVLMDVDVPSLGVMLPDSIARTVQQLQPLQGVRFGSRKGGGVFEPLPVRRRGSLTATDATQPPAHVKVNLNLGKEVKVGRESSLEVTLTGHPQMVLSDTVSVTGQIQLVRGFLDVEGKRFDIEQGTISFVGDDPTNPQADVTASWQAPDGTVVYADFSGPLRNGKVTLRSDPPLAKNEIMSLMVFGSTSGGASSATNQAQVSGSNVIGVAQGAATQPINHALQDYGLGGVSTRIDTSNVNPRPEVEVRIARDIALQIAWVLGTPPPGSNPDRTLFTIDWQFFRRWALETTVGDAGTSIADVVWQYGY